MDDYVRSRTNTARFGPFWISGRASARVDATFFIFVFIQTRALGPDAAG